MIMQRITIILWMIQGSRDLLIIVPRCWYVIYVGCIPACAVFAGYMSLHLHLFGHIFIRQAGLFSWSSFLGFGIYPLTLKQQTMVSLIANLTTSPFLKIVTPTLAYRTWNHVSLHVPKNTEGPEKENNQ